MSHYRGLTWDHPRGRNALAAAARDSADDSFSIDWHVQPLEGFESASIEELAREYDLIVLDHPHLGDAIASGSLRPLDTLFSAEEIEAIAADSVGPSIRSYLYDDRLLALPLDAATQVSVRRPDILPTAPRTWNEVLELSAEAPVALSLAGPHAFLSLCSIVVALGEEPTSDGDAPFLPAVSAAAALELMTILARRAPEGSAGLNPIALLEAMSGGDSIAYCPLVYGYVNYSSASREHPLAFGNAPTDELGGRPGSTIGGTGIAISRRTEVTPALLDHIRWLMSPSTQARYIPEHDGQPSARSAWTDASVNAASLDFYRDTLDTIEQAWVRPRFPGYVPLQSAASAVVRDVLTGIRATDDAISSINSMMHSMQGARP
ncbi:extracellular solute-binding protein [soil metagenome]